MSQLRLHAVCSVQVSRLVSCTAATGPGQRISLTCEVHDNLPHPSSLLHAKAPSTQLGFSLDTQLDPQRDHGWAQALAAHNYPSLVLICHNAQEAYPQVAGAEPAPQTWPGEQQKLPGKLQQRLQAEQPACWQRVGGLGCPLPPAAWAGTAASEAQHPARGRTSRPAMGQCFRQEGRLVQLQHSRCDWP